MVFKEVMDFCRNCFGGKHEDKEKAMEKLKQVASSNEHSEEVRQKATEAISKCENCDKSKPAIKEHLNPILPDVESRKAITPETDVEISEEIKSGKL